MERDTPLTAIAEQRPVGILIARRGDHQNVADLRQHQRGDRVVDHRFVVNRHELLADRNRQRVQAGTRTAGENDALVCHSFILDR